MVPGLACAIAGITEITDEMLYAAAVACTNTMTQEEIDEGRTFPALRRIRDVSRNVACEVIQTALKHKQTTKVRAEDFPSPEILESFVARRMYKPFYVPLYDR